MENVWCANTQPFSCNEFGAFQSILGDFQVILGNLLGPFSGDFRQLQAISGNFSQFRVILGDFGGAKTQEKTVFVN